MRFIPIGIASEKDFRKFLNADNFTDEKFECVQLRTDKDDNTVMIMHCKAPSPFEWRVKYRYTTVCFDSLKEAIAFCEEHGMKQFGVERSN